MEEQAKECKHKYIDRSFLVYRCLDCNKRFNKKPKDNFWTGFAESLRVSVRAVRAVNVRTKLDLIDHANKRLKEDVKEREAKIEILNNSCAFNIEEIKNLENKLSSLTGIAKKFKDRVSPEEFFLNEGDFMSNTLSKKVEEYIKHITK